MVKMHVRLYMVHLFFYSLHQEKVQSLSTEAGNYKKSIVKEQEKNEELTLSRNKIDTDIAHITKQIEMSANKRDQLKTEFMTYTRTYQETEQSLAKATIVSFSTGNCVLPLILCMYDVCMYVCMYV